MGFEDIFKSSFLSGFSGNVTTIDVIIAMATTSLLALFIFLIYRVVTRKTFYSRSFNVSLALIAVITASIILAIQSNIVISLGMVGALSIVRFRTAIKDPTDLMFLFWSISVGIICGAGIALVAVIASIVVAAGLFFLNLIPVAQSPKILVVDAMDSSAESEIKGTIDKYCKHCKAKSRSRSAGKLDIVFEVRVKEEQLLVDQLSNIQGVNAVSLLAHD
ncbi:DUF4956 domain-containing protein, partial [Ruminococcaceae bacterium OttesenSCG-928-D13]|nr:DUF4956 domain-containing protein [Ruminococcaceae bacterium OttesenSCG-928-D13]